MKTLLTILPTFLSHGALEFPPSRQWLCSRGPQPNLSTVWGGGDDPICQQVFSHNPTLATTWSGVAIGSAAGRIGENYDSRDPLKAHRLAMGKDAKICSAGKSEFSAALQSNVDWLTKATEISPGRTEFVFVSSAPHRIDGSGTANSPQGYYDFYITKNKNFGLKDLTFADLQPLPFCTHRTRIDKSAKREVMFCDVPKLNGPYTIFTVWQRSKSPEAFYGCSDVYITGNEDTTEISITEATESTSPGTITETVTDEISEEVTEFPTERPTLVPTEPSTDAVTEEISEEITEVITDQPTVNPTESVTIEPESITDDPTTESSTDFVTEENSDAVTEQPSKEHCSGQERGQYSNTENYEFDDIIKLPNENDCYRCKIKQWCNHHFYPLGRNWFRSWEKIENCRFETKIKTDVPCYASDRQVLGNTVVQRDGHLYRCKGEPVSDRCSSEPFHYAPGAGDDWESAWELLSELDESVKLILPDREHCSGNIRGSYVHDEDYSINDVVENNGDCYRCKYDIFCSDLTYSPFSVYGEMAWKKLDNCNIYEQIDSAIDCYSENDKAGYSVGSIVQMETDFYECLIEHFCNLGGYHYGPGFGYAWTQAWKKL